jgi:hypothetical protein
MSSLTTRARLFYATTAMGFVALLGASGAHAMLPRDLSAPAGPDSFAAAPGHAGIAAGHSSSPALLIACVVAAVLALLVVASVTVIRRRKVGVARG